LRSKIEKKSGEEAMPARRLVLGPPVYKSWIRHCLPCFFNWLFTDFTLYRALFQYSAVELTWVGSKSGRITKSKIMSISGLWRSNV